MDCRERELPPAASTSLSGAGTPGRHAARVKAAGPPARSAQRGARDRSPRSALNADVRLIERVIENLLNNAIRFTPVGGMVTVTCGRAEAGVVLTVTDSGPGFAAADHRRLFGRSIAAGSRWTALRTPWDWVWPSPTGSSSFTGAPWKRSRCRSEGRGSHFRCRLGSGRCQCESGRGMTPAPRCGRATGRSLTSF